MRAKVLVEKIAASFPGIKVDDILLYGSSASYLYHQGSDFDVKVQVSFEKISSLSKIRSGRRPLSDDMWRIIIPKSELISFCNDETHHTLSIDLPSEYLKE